VIIAGLSTPLFGVARAQAVVNWLASAGPLLMRLDAVIGMALVRLCHFIGFPRESVSDLN